MLYILKNISFFAIILISFSCFSQKNEPYKAIKDSINKYTYSNISKAISYADSYVSLSQKKRDQEEELNGMYLTYSVYHKNLLKGEKIIEPANKQLELLEKFAKKNNLKEHLAEIFYKKSNLSSFRNSDNKDSGMYSMLHHLNLSLNIAKEIENFHFEIRARILLILIKMSGENCLEALEDLEALSKEVKDKKNDTTFTPEIKFRYLGLIYHNLVKNHLQLKNLTKANSYNEILFSYYFKQIDSSFTNANSEERFMYFYNKNKGEIYFAKKEYDSAEKYFNKLFVKKITNLNFRKDSVRLLGKVACMKQQYSKAIEILSPFEEVIDSSLTYSESEDEFKYLGLSYKGLSDYKKANFFLEKYIESIALNNTYKDSLNLNLKKLEIQEVQAEIDTIKTLSKKRRTSIFILSALIIFIIIGFIYYSLKVKQKNKIKYDALIKKLNTKPVSKTVFKINDSEIERVISNLKKLEQKEFYLNQNCSLVTTAKSINTNSSYLSKIVNTHFKKTFNAYINELRINYVLTRLKKDRLFRRYTIQSIANEIGYKSKESFNKAFKKESGILPSFYIKQLELEP